MHVKTIIMKFSIKTNFIILLCLLTILSCSKEDVGNDETAETQKMQALIGTELRVLDGGAFNVIFNENDNTIQVWGGKDDYAITLFFNNSFETQSLNFAKLEIGDWLCIFGCDNPATVFIMESGTITLTEYSETIIAGSFNFIAKDENSESGMTVANGIFEIEY